MRKANLICTALLLAFFFNTASVFGQTYNSYKFIEPSASISYDSNSYKIKEHYSNTLYESEAYDFSGHTDPGKEVTIHIEPMLIDIPLTKSDRDGSLKMLLDNAKMAQAVENDSFKILNVDTQIREINDWGCVGVVVHEKKDNTYETTIVAFHISPDDKIQIEFSSNHNDLEKGYSILADFLKGFKSYSKESFEKEKEQMLTYKIEISPVAREKNDPRLPGYTGVVTINPKPGHKVWGVRIPTSTYSEELFEADSTGKVYISINDQQKGEVTKTGKLVFLTSIGKKIAVPFTFTYTNK